LPALRDDFEAGPRVMQRRILNAFLQDGVMRQAC